VEQLQEIGIRRVQIALDPFREAPGTWNALPALCAERGVSLASGMFGTVGEDYSTPETIRRTGGVVPDGTWEENWRNIQAVADIAQGIGLKLVTFHAGFLPHKKSDPLHRVLQDRIARIADLFAAKHLALGMETGQETAEGLEAFLRELDRPNVGVNFDPANIILYNNGDPIAGLQRLAPWVRQCHIKDAVKPNAPGQWGREVRVGTGEVDWAAFMRVLQKMNIKGDLAIEREDGEERVADIRAARKFLEKL
jgi:sugar phosphate isomerase/epimerase